MTVVEAVEMPAPVEGAGEAALAELLSTVAEAERLQARAVALAGSLASSGVAERVEGLPLELVLASAARLTGADRHMLVTAGQVLESMPGVAGLFAAGRLSWGEVRTVVRAVRRRSLEDRAFVDARVVAAVGAEGGAERWDPDALVAAVDAAVDELVSRQAVERREDRAAAANRLWAQESFDGRVDGGFSLDALSGATVLNALAAEQGVPCADDPERAAEEPSVQQRSQADALVSLCERALAGGGAGGRARPRFVVDVDLDRLEDAQAGRLRLRLPGAPRRVTTRRLARLAAGGVDVRVILTRDGAAQAVSRTVGSDQATLDRDRGAVLANGWAVPPGQREGLAVLLAAVDRALDDPALAGVLDGDRPLTDPALLHAAAIPAAVREAVAARDGGCRFLGCRAPVDWCDVHHITWRSAGGVHHVDDCVLLCRGDHRLVHDHRWQLTLNPNTGALTGRRGKRTWTTQPRGTPLPPDPRPPRPPPGSGSDPPSNPPTRAGPPDGLPF